MQRSRSCTFELYTATRTESKASGKLATKPTDLKCDASADITPQLQGAKPPTPLPPWQSDQYNKSVYTIGQKGCAITSLSMALEGAGMTVDPETLNLLLNAFGGYLPGLSRQGLPSSDKRWGDAVVIANKHLPGSTGTSQALAGRNHFERDVPRDDAKTSLRNASTTYIIDIDA